MNQKCQCGNEGLVKDPKLEALDKVLDEYGKVPGSLITILQKTQAIYGYIPKDIITHISQATKVKSAKIYGVATFYSQFRLEPIGKYLIMLCQGTACHVNGSDEIAKEVSEFLGIQDGETTEDGVFTINNVACLGCCSLAPVMMIRSADGDETYGNLTKEKVVDILTEIRNRSNDASDEEVATCE